MFELKGVRIDADGVLTLTGIIRSPDIAKSSVNLAFAIMGRKSKAVHEYAVQMTDISEGLEIRSSIAMTQLGLASDDLADVFLVSRTPSDETRIRVIWDVPQAEWLPYPTKFGNLSLKRRRS